MKKKHIFYYLFASIFLISCSNDDDFSSVDYTPDIRVVNLKDVKPELRSALDSLSIDMNEYVLKFKNEQIYLNTIEKLSKLTSEERSNWSSAFSCFISSDNIFNQAMLAADSLEFNTVEEYSYFKNEYQKYLYFPEHDEDFGAYLPYADKIATATYSKSGIIMIGDNIILKDRITTYEELQKTGQAYYDLKRETISQTSSNNDLMQSYTSARAAGLQYLNGKIRKFDKVGKGDYLSSQFTTGWIQKGDRRLQLKVNYIVELNKDAKLALKWHTEVSFRKSTVLGWVNYSSTTELYGHLTAYDDNGSGPDFYSIYHKSDHPSSHDGYGSPVKCILLAEGQLIVDNDYNPSNGGAGNIPGRSAYHLPRISGQLYVYYQGFGTTSIFWINTDPVNFVLSTSLIDNTNNSGIYTLNQYSSAGYYFNWSKYLK